MDYIDRRTAVQLIAEDLIVPAIAASERLEVKSAEVRHQQLVVIKAEIKAYLAVAAKLGLDEEVRRSVKIPPYLLD
jgi:hypothetical protein